MATNPLVKLDVQLMYLYVPAYHVVFPGLVTVMLPGGGKATVIVAIAWTLAFE